MVFLDGTASGIRGGEDRFYSQFFQPQVHALGNGLVSPFMRRGAKGMRSWLEWAADHVLDRVPSREAGLAYAGGDPGRDGPRDLAARLREAWAVRDAQSEIGEKRSEISEEQPEEREAPQSLADRLRVASKGLDHDEIAARLAAIRQGREVAERDKARELERQHAEELEQEAHRHRDWGLDHAL